MKLNRYDKFILESTMYELILESKVRYMSEFKLLLIDIVNNNSDPEIKRVSMFLKHISDKDLDKLNQNYINVNNESPDKLTFLPDNKVVDKIFNLEFGEKTNSLYNIVDDKIIDIVGIPRKELSYPTNLSDIPSNEWTIIDLYDCANYNEDYGNYILYHLNNKLDNDYNIVVCYNKLEENPFKDRGLPENLRGSIKIGRFINNLISLYKKDDKYNDALINNITPSSVEKFVNALTARINYNNNILDYMEIVEGEDIRKWYSEHQYASYTGELGNSCMRFSNCKKYFDIYVENPEVCKMLILKNQKGDRILGRALLWINTNEDRTMDRIYASNDSYKNLFETWANDNGYIYDAEGDFSVAIKNLPYDYFPYMDSYNYYKFCDTLDEFEQGHGNDINYKATLNMRKKSPCYGLSDTNGGHFSERY